jgi:hypothetical protein
MSRCLGGVREKEIFKKISVISHNAHYCHLTIEGSQTLRCERERDILFPTIINNAYILETIQKRKKKKS